MQEHYKYFWACTGNAMRESLFSFQLIPLLLTYQRKAVALFEQKEWDKLTII